MQILIWFTVTELFLCLPMVTHFPALTSSTHFPALTSGDTFPIDLEIRRAPVDTSQWLCRVPPRLLT